MSSSAECQWWIIWNRNQGKNPIYSSYKK
jgi:hypothetical protein